MSFFSPSTPSGFIFHLNKVSVQLAAAQITNQFPTDECHGFFPGPTLANEVLDQEVRQAYRESQKGESMRKLKAKKVITS